MYIMYMMDNISVLVQVLTVYSDNNSDSDADNHVDEDNDENSDSVASSTSICWA